MSEAKVMNEEDIKICRDAINTIGANAISIELCERLLATIDALTAERDDYKRRAEVAEEVASWLTNEVMGYVPVVEIELESGELLQPYSICEAANMKYALAEAEVEE